MNKIFKGFALALSMLSIIPFFKVHDFYKGINGYAVMFYPLIGLVLGSILYFLYLFLEPFAPQTHLHIIIFAMWVLLTGALHLDGLSDSIDSFFVNKQRSLEVMKDPSVGAMGMIFSTVFLLLKASSLIALEAIYLLPVVLLLSRLNASLAIYFFPYISKNGMGAMAKEEFCQTQLLITLAYSCLFVFVFDAWILMFFSLLTLFVLKHFFAKRYGGFSGDLYGFTIELTELVLLNAIILGALS